MKTVFVIDDSRTILLSVGGILKSAGYEVRTFTSGPEVLSALGTGAAPSLLITDYNMPDMDGVALIQKARKLPTCRFTPILMLTTESQVDKRAAAKAAGATGWLVKPISADDLLTVIARVVPS